jgi:hypothetical protein
MALEEGFKEFELEENTRCTKCGDKNPLIEVEAIPIVPYLPGEGPFVTPQIIPGLVLSCLCESCRNESRTFVLTDITEVKIEELVPDKNSGGPLRFKVNKEE